MTKPSHGSSLLQARDSRSHSHSHSFFHRFRHRLLHAHDPEQRSFGDDAASDNGFGHHLGANVELDSSNNALAKRDSSETTQQVAVNATIYSPPNTIVVDPQSGKTIDTSSGPESTVALPGPTPSGSGYSSSSLDSATSTSLGPVPTSTTPSSATVKPAYPSLRNDINYRFVNHLGNQEYLKIYPLHPLDFVGLFVLLFVVPFFVLLVLLIVVVLLFGHDDRTGQWLWHDHGSRQPANNTIGNRLQQRRQPDATAEAGGATSRTLGAGTPGDSGSGGAMAERAAAPGAVAAALASLTGKRAPQTSHSADSGERGFYRVSGRKLPSVLHNGGDGYSDPRGSATSGSSDYYRGSQAFEPTSAGKGQLALGVPMRPVSGVPIIRSGPARIPITQNPFADPPASTNNLSTRTLGSGESPRASGSKFQEKI
ncbi:hypothetical protein MAC_09606 [Metarhizium acridum CQMa 102]|uniref:Uncharacterized protein n=1 Tax=Metarhizium acridum (strain CQMa 102) TaxID=655827 RepID=E9EIA8_METAQ|nr:uncharacterized protein MAC_09606 [Metarhizium acridum CQMa 102]EFY84354.1 hypothetical protein MAC_09606 [Metarhizium acridum CQMa 102]